MAIKLLWLAIALLLPLLAFLAKRQQQEKELREIEAFRQLMNSDLGEAHPLWKPPQLCPAPSGITLRPARYLGLNFCPPVMAETMRSKVNMDSLPVEYDGTKRVALDSERRDPQEALAEYWVLDAAAILAVIGAHANLSKWLLNLGARPTALVGNALRELVVGDDVTQLWPMGYSGINFELPEHLPATLEFHSRWPKARVDTSGTTPDAMVRRMRELQVPEDLDIAKLDVDSYDCEFLEALLEAGFRPKVITMELLSSFPPPLKFKAKMEGYPVAQTRYGPLQGCSLQYAYDYLRPLGYTLIQYVVEDGWFVLNEYAPLFGLLHTNVSDHYSLGNPLLVAKWPWPDFMWSLYRKRDEPEKMLAQARRGVEALITLRPGLEALQYSLEVPDKH